MPHDLSQSRRMRSSSSGHTSTSNTSHWQSQRHLQSSIMTPLPGGRGTGTQYGTRTHGHRPPPQIRTENGQSQADQQHTKQSSRNDYIAPTEPRHSPGHLGSGAASADHRRGLPKLRTMDILRDPRLQRTTGFLPEKATSWRDRVIPPDELDKLACAMSLPDMWPAKRSRGNSSKG